MRQDLSLLSDDCPSLLFNGKFADLVTLNCGGPHEPRPMLKRVLGARLTYRWRVRWIDAMTADSADLQEPGQHG